MEQVLQRKFLLDAHILGGFSEVVGHNFVFLIVQVVLDCVVSLAFKNFFSCFDDRIFSMITCTWVHRKCLLMVQ